MAEPTENSHQAIQALFLHRQGLERYRKEAGLAPELMMDTVLTFEGEQVSARVPVFNPAETEAQLRFNLLALQVPPDLEGQ